MQAKLDYVESTYANSVLDLQANKIDLAFALNPTPQRALAVGFTQPYYLHPFGCVARKGFAANVMGGTEQARNPHGLPDRRAVGQSAGAFRAQGDSGERAAGDDAILQMQAGRADCIIYALIQALGVSARAPGLEQVTLLRQPYVAVASALGIQEEPDRRWRDFLDSWIEYYRGTRQIGGWIRDGLVAMGVRPESIPPNADL